MVDQEHFDILMQGVDVWNKWREENPKIWISFGGYDLRRSSLAYGKEYGDLGYVADLSGINFSGIELVDTSFKNMCLVEANLSGSNVSESNLSGAHLRKANLRSADLRGVDFSKANLSEANLSGTDLRGSIDHTGTDHHTDYALIVFHTNFSDALLFHTNFSRANLSRIDLSQMDLQQVVLDDANLQEANLANSLLQGICLTSTNLSGANLRNANLRNATLRGVNLSDADLTGADLSNAKILKTNFSGAILSTANFSHALLDASDLSGAYLCGTNFHNATFIGCRIYGIAAWDTQLDDAKQENFIITPPEQSEITVDNLEVAQFIYLLLNDAKIRNVINTITSKVVLILGRFTDERKPVLDALRDELRKYNFSPVVFDFDPSAKRDLTETVSLLANMSRFVIADITDAKSIPQELHAIVPHLPSVIVQPILHIDAREYAMFEHYERYPWVLPIYHYQDIPSLLASIEEHIIKPVEKMEREKDKTKALEDKVRILEDENRKLRGGK